MKNKYWCLHFDICQVLKNKLYNCISFLIFYTAKWVTLQKFTGMLKKMKYFVQVSNIKLFREEFCKIKNF